MALTRNEEVLLLFIDSETKYGAVINMDDLLERIVAKKIIITCILTNLKMRGAIREIKPKGWKITLKGHKFANYIKTKGIA